MGALFNRQFALNAGGLSFATSSTDPSQIHSTLRVAFRAERNSQKEPSPAEITIWNLSKDSRAFLESIVAPVVLEAGYAGQAFQIFSGDLIYAATQRQGVDWVTKLQIQDGARKYRSARINESLGPGTTLSDAIQKAADALGLPLGNLTSHLSPVRGKTTAFGKGVVLSGKAEEQLDKLLKLAGYEWSIQDGQLQVLAPAETLPTEIVVLNSDSGLVGSPESARDDKTKKTFVKARSLLQPGLFPGRTVRLEGAAVSGDFKIERAIYTGDSWGQDWYVDIEAKPL